MNKKILTILAFLFLSIMIVVYSDSNKKDESSVNIFNTLKKDCLAVSPVDGKYYNDRYNLQFDYPEYLSVCERYTFNTKNQGVEIYVWGKSDFNSSNSTDGPKIVFYINKNLTLNKDLMELYNMEGFEEAKTLSNDLVIFKKVIQPPSCFEEGCRFNVYKIDHDKDIIFIKEYEEVEDVVDSLSLS